MGKPASPAADVFAFGEACGWQWEVEGCGRLSARWPPPIRQPFIFACCDACPPHRPTCRRGHVGGSGLGAAVGQARPLAGARRWAGARDQRRSSSCAALEWGGASAKQSPCAASPSARRSWVLCCTAGGRSCHLPTSCRGWTRRGGGAWMLTWRCCGAAGRRRRQTARPLTPSPPSSGGALRRGQRAEGSAGAAMPADAPGKDGGQQEVLRPLAGRPAHHLQPTCAVPRWQPPAQGAAAKPVLRPPTPPAGPSWRRRAALPPQPPARPAPAAAESARRALRGPPDVIDVCDFSCSAVLHCTVKRCANARHIAQASIQQGGRATKARRVHTRMGSCKRIETGGAPCAATVRAAAAAAATPCAAIGLTPPAAAAAAGCARPWRRPRRGARGRPASRSWPCTAPSLQQGNAAPTVKTGNSEGRAGIKAWCALRTAAPTLQPGASRAGGAGGAVVAAAAGQQPARQREGGRRGGAPVSVSSTPFSRAPRKAPASTPEHRHAASQRSAGRPHPRR